MNWKARALSTTPLTDAHLQSLITRGKPVDYATAVALVGMVVAARGDIVEGVKMEDAAKIPATKEAKAPKGKPSNSENIPVSELVSSEDNKTPWTKVVADAKKDDRLQMSLDDGLIYPVKKSG